MDHKPSQAVDPQLVMGTEQPNTISIDGVEVPSWYYVWKKLVSAERRMKALSLICALQGVAIMLLGIAQLLR